MSTQPTPDLQEIFPTEATQEFLTSGTLEAALDAQLKQLGGPKIRYIHKEAGDIWTPRMLGLMSRETGMLNVTGGGYFKQDGFAHAIFVRTGVDRGGWQLNINSHHEFLASHPGCKSGSWVEEPGHRASEVGYCPQLGPSLHYVLTLRKTAILYAQKNKVAPEDLIRFMYASHNRGDHGCLVAYQHGGIAYVDSLTTHGNYSADCENRATLITKLLPQYLA